MKIITALNNPKINTLLKKERIYEVIGKDIQYKEAIIDILEKNKNIDIIIINSKIPGEMKLEKLIEEIKKFNKKIKIIILLKNKENYKYNNLKRIGIKNIYKLKNINYNIVSNILKQSNLSNNKNIKKNNCIKTENSNKKIVLIYGLKKDKENLIIKKIISYLINKNRKILLINIKNKNIYQKYKNNKKITENNYKKNIKKVNYFYNYYKNRKIKSENEINNFLKKEKKNFDFIFIEIKNVDDENFFKEILKNITDILIFMNGNLLGVKAIHQFAKKYQRYFLKEEIGLHIIEKQTKFYSINTNILKDILNISFKKYSINISKFFKNTRKFLMMINNMKLNMIIKKIFYYLLKNNKTNMKNKIIRNKLFK